MEATFTNRKALSLWFFSAVFVAIVAAFTWLVIRDGPPQGYAPLLVWTIVVVFWCAGLGLVAFAWSLPCISVHASASAVTVRWRHPTWVHESRVARAAVPPAVVVERKDSDGDPYYCAQFALRDGRTVDLLETHVREACEEACARFNATGRRRG